MHSSLIIILDPLKAHLGDLFRDQAHQKNQDRVDEENCGQVGEPVKEGKGVQIIGQAQQKNQDTDWEKDFEGRKKGRDPEHDQEEP